MLNTLTSKDAQDLIARIEKLFKDLPHLPKGLVEFIIKVTPWFALLGGILNIPAALSNFSLATGSSVFGNIFTTTLGVNSGYFYLSAFFSIIYAVLLLMAFKPLKENRLTGWIYIFWTEVAMLIQTLATAFFVAVFPVGGVIFALLGFYALFEIKSHYKK